MIIKAFTLVTLNLLLSMASQALKNEGKNNYISMQGKEINIGYINQEEYDQLIKYIYNTEKTVVNIDGPLSDIITEELKTLFIGDKTSEEVAKSIQSRASIMISEQA